MRHHVSGRPLGRNTAHRRALLRNLVTSFLRAERIETTEAKAKEVRALADQMITLGKRGDLHARRQVAAFLFDPAVVAHLFSSVAPRFTNRNGGYTRIIKTRRRYGDAAPMVILELTEAKAPEPTAASTPPPKETPAPATQDSEVQPPPAPAA